LEDVSSSCAGTEGVDIQDIMQEVQRLAASMRGDEMGYVSVPRTDWVPNGSARIPEVDSMHRSWDIPFNRPISKSGNFRLVRYLFKRLVRKSLFWFVGPALTQQREFNAQATRAAEALARSVANLESAATEIRSSLDGLYATVVQLQTQLQKLATEHEIAFDYVAFENQYRGPREEVLDRFRAYLSVLPADGEVVDIGCGRGEMLQLLRERGVVATGVDFNPDMVEECHNLGLNAVLGDGTEFLRTRADDSLSAIFVGQVIEHLTNRELEELLRACHSKLRVGGTLIMETPNPASVTVLSQSYFMDPTHRALRHPLTMEFMLKDYGFDDVSLSYSSPMPPEFSVEDLDLDREVVSTLKRWHAVLFGFQDYAVIGRKASFSARGKGVQEVARDSVASDDI